MYGTDFKHNRAWNKNLTDSLVSYLASLSLFQYCFDSYLSSGLWVRSVTLFYPLLYFSTNKNAWHSKRVAKWVSIDAPLHRVYDIVSLCSNMLKSVYSPHSMAAEKLRIKGPGLAGTGFQKNSAEIFVQVSSYSQSANVSFSRWHSTWYGNQRVRDLWGISGDYAFKKKNVSGEQMLLWTHSKSEQNHWKTLFMSKANLYCAVENVLSCCNLLFIKG